MGGRRWTQATGGCRHLPPRETRRGACSKRTVAHMASSTTDPESPCVFFSVNDLVDVTAVLRASEQWRGRTGILISERALHFTGLTEWEAICAHVKRVAPWIRVGLDHVRSEAQLRTITDATDLLYRVDIVMLDGSAMSVRENARFVRRLAQQLPTECAVEAAVGVVGTGPADSTLTSVHELELFLGDAQCDYLGVSVRNYHLSEAPQIDPPSLDMERVAELAASSVVPLVLHGADFRESRELAVAIHRGISKVNLGPELRLLYSTLLTQMQVDRGDYRPALSTVRASLEEHVRDRVSGILG